MAEAAPLLKNKHYGQASVFRPERLLREARRQKELPAGNVPAVCVLDPDGDIVAYLLRKKWARRNRAWSCYHTALHEFERNGMTYGIIGCAVGGPFAVLLAEQLFVSGCRVLISITSAGQIRPLRPPPYFVLIEKALRDEGASHHYLPPAPYAHLGRVVRETLAGALKHCSPAVERGATWTTDAPYRETADAIRYAKAEGILAVEMEAASLYAFAEARRKTVVCFAHVTNQMGNTKNDFEKGESSGSVASLQLIETVARCLRRKTRSAEAVSPGSVCVSRSKKRTDT
ncbi:MAG: nucleoside phosphorylase [bacterium]